MKKMIVDEQTLTFINDYIENPDKYVFPFVIKEKNKERTIITYNKSAAYGEKLRSIHEELLDRFIEMFQERNSHSFAYHKNVRCYDALQDHLKSNFFIKLDIHSFFESIIVDKFFEIYGEYFNELWKTIIRGFFYKDHLSIGYVSSPSISDFFMRKFDNNISKFIENNPELHYSRYSDDILISSEEDNDESLNNLFSLIKDELNKLGLEINVKKTRNIKLDYKSHNSISFLGLNLSKDNEIDNKITISKRYILFLLFLIAKQKGYKDHCYPLENEIKSRVAYLAYNSPISFNRFQKKHINLYGEPFNFVPKELPNRSVSNVSNEIPDFEQYADAFKINIHKKIKGKEKRGFMIKDGIEIEKCLDSSSQKIVLPDFIDSVGANAFKNNRKVKVIVLNPRLKNIESSAFEGCISLEEIILPPSLRFIGANAFKDCKNLKSIVLPQYVKDIQPSAFMGSGIEKIVINEGVDIIFENAFSGCLGLKEVIFPNESLKEIRSDAFSGCIKLKEIALPNGLINIEQNAFKNCYSLIEVKTPDTLLGIGNYAFSTCTSLKRFYISKSISNIFSQSFENCYNLLEFDISKENMMYRSTKSKRGIVEINTNRLIVSLDDVIDEDIKIIGKDVFMNRQFFDIKLPEGLVSIEDRAFHNNDHLEKIILPESIKEIGAEVFAFNINLREVYLNKNIEIIPRGAFKGCVNLEKIHNIDQIKVISDEAFFKNNKLEFNIPNSVIEVGYKAFYNCYQIKDLYISKNLKKINKNAFYGLSKTLNTIKVDELNPNYSSGNDSNYLSISNKGEIILGCKNSKIDNGIHIIKDHAFIYCKELESISFANTTTTIGNEAFLGCESLKEVNLNNVSSIGKKAFSGCLALKNIILPECLTSIGERSFQNTGLVSIKLPNSLTNIGTGSFSNCYDLREIYFSSTFKDYNETLFENCSKISKIEVDTKNTIYDSRNNSNALIDSTYDKLLLGSSSTIIPDNVIVIYARAFKNNVLLENIVIPPSVKDIGSDVFSGCSNLKNIEIETTILNYLPSNFAKNCVELEEIYIPDSILSIGNGSFSGCKKLKHVKLPSELKEISINAFSNTALEEINLPKKINAIRREAFNNCQELKKINFPFELEVIDSNAFAQTGFKEVNLSLCPGLYSIGQSAFEKMENLEKVTLPPYLEVISSSLFSSCHNLKEVIAGDELKTISDYAFYDCYYLNPNSILEKAIKNIGRYAFNNNRVIKNLLIGKEVNIVYPNSFKGCDLDTIEVDNENKKYFTSKDNTIYENVLDLYIGTQRVKMAVFGCKNSTLANDTVIVGSNAFDGIKLSKIDLPNRVRIIENNAFSNNEMIQKIVLPEHLINIESSAFYNCSSLKEVAFNDELLSIGSLAFAYCDLKKISLPKKLNSLDNSAFTGNKLEEIYVDEWNFNFTSMNSNVLINRDSNTLLFASNKGKVPAGVTLIAKQSFSGTDIKEVILPSGVIKIDHGAFSNNKEIEKLEIPETTLSIEEDFAINTRINKIYVDKNNPIYEARNNNTTLFDKRYNKLLYSCDFGVIEEGVRFVSNYIFDIPNLDKIHIPSSISYLSESLVQYCNTENVTSIEVDKNNPFLESRDNCNAIIAKESNTLLLGCSKTNIPLSVNKIGHYSFINIGHSIKDLFIHKNINLIASSAFKKEDNGFESIVVDKDNKTFDSRNNCNAIILTKDNMAVLTCQNTILPEGVFYQSQIQSSYNRFILDSDDDLPF